MTATTRTTRSSCRVSGLGGRSACAVIDAIEAMVVLGPVAETTARASPDMTNVPARTGSPDLAGHRSALAGDHRLVDGESACLDQQHVGRDPGPGGQQHHVVDDEVLDRHVGSVPLRTTRVVAGSRARSSCVDRSAR